MSSRLSPVAFLGPAALAAGVAGACLALLGGALVFEHGLGLAPCPLCLVQRGPLLVAAILAGVAAVSFGFERTAGQVALGAAGLVLLVSAGLGIYHGGIENGWWAGPAACAGTTFRVPGTAAELEAARQAAAIVRCDVVPWTLFGLSLADFNAVLSAALALVAAAGVRARNA